MQLGAILGTLGSLPHGARGDKAGTHGDIDCLTARGEGGELQKVSRPHARPLIQEQRAIMHAALTAARERHISESADNPIMAARRTGTNTGARTAKHMLAKVIEHPLHARSGAHHGHHASC